LLADGDKLGIDRVFSFSSSACNFLQSNGFDFAGSFSSAVQYLSREDEHQAYENFKRRHVNKDEIPDLQIKDEDLEFYHATRQVVNNWLKLVSD
jgi:poly(A)-specific ribonuclease